MNLKKNLIGANKKMFTVVGIGLIVLFATLGIDLFYQDSKPIPSTTGAGNAFVTFIGSDAPTIEVEIADSEEERSLGLMNRESMEWSRGMLFIFDQPQQLSFWMKNTLIPLDIIFIDEEGQITKIHQNAEPNNTITKYKSEFPSKYAIEVNEGFSDKHRIRAGDRVEITL